MNPVHVGLVRHFPVRQNFPTGWRTTQELAEWYRSYDLAETHPIPCDLGGIAWRVCLCSDLPRARVTAEALFRGVPEPTPLLREASLEPFATGRLRLPVFVWKWLLRLAWTSGHASQRACRDDMYRRVHGVADRLAAVEVDTLVVSHAGTMSFLSRELRRRGFDGPRLGVAKHARLYLYSRHRTS
ncbi:MAG: histidine phosphatase family protein [Verrucomicrobiales bacterium]|nr:histidine phosphatase family protein [Verrucomicrobiales bacterium]